MHASIEIMVRNRTALKKTINSSNIYFTIHQAKKGATSMLVTNVKDCVSDIFEITETVSKCK